MFGLDDREKKIKVNSVWVMFCLLLNLDGCDRQEATNQWRGQQTQAGTSRKLMYQGQL